MTSSINFGEDHLGKDLKAFKFADDPFVVSITCEPLFDGFATEWVVTGKRRWDSKPRFLLRLQMGIQATSSELRDQCLEIWQLQLKDLAYGAANQGGIDAQPNTMSKKYKDLHAEWHLKGNDLLGHFNQISETYTERTANMFNLLKSMGYLQAPKMLAHYEAKESEGEVKESTINRRLHMARQAGLIAMERSKNFEYQDEN
jgi:hypothetical protein